MTERKPIFPDLMIHKSSTFFQILTYLRIKHRGKYYLQAFLRSGPIASFDIDLREMIYGIYMTIHFGKVLPKLKDSHGVNLFELDTDQTNEKERLKKIHGRA